MRSVPSVIPRQTFEATTTMSTPIYGDRDPRKTKSKHRPISSSTAASFSSNLSALISSAKAKSSDSPSTAAAAAAKTNKRKADIFTSHNRNVKARAASDLEQVHKTKADLDAVSASELHRSRRKMEEKARLYKQMKRGEHIGRRDYDGQSLVDFDRKWYEDGQRRPDDVDSDGASSDDSDLDNADEPAEWLDEFGRLRKGTKREKERSERQQRIQQSASTAAQEDRAFPQAPANIIYGDTIQHAAFNPDARIAEQMAEIAAKRDKSATPPPETHYNAAYEIRNRGTGFYAFSGDAQMRKEEMDSLAKQRAETERIRKQKEEEAAAAAAAAAAKEKRTSERGDRQEAMDAKRDARAEKEVDDFLHSLDIPNAPNG
ncbi:hypothetical protein DV737_g1291, partial [Chaetothyriales sp. CBS 132003]